MNTILDTGRVEIKLGDYGVAPATALADPALLPVVQDYRRAIGARMYPLDRDDIGKKIPTADYHVSRKVDGEFTVLIYRDSKALTLNPGGTVRVGLPWLAEAERLLAKAGIKEAMIVGELYVHTDDRRERVHDVTSVARQPQSANDLARLRLAVFDIITIDGLSHDAFAETWTNIQRIFTGGELIHPVHAKFCSNSDEVQNLFEKWVEGEGAEGLVVRSDTAGTFKIKPRHNLDAVVIGFTESSDDRQGMLHDLLLAVMRPDKTLHVLSRVGGGFSEEQRREMLSDLKDIVVDSEYAEVNSDHVAYQMVQPNWVVEISCLDLISQTTRGGPVNRMVLDYRDNGTKQYDVVRRLPLAAVISPQFVRRREDKTAHPNDIRIAQVSERVEVPLADRDARQLTLPKSEVLKREVYTKVVKEQTMVRKFVMWKTNKETGSEEYPAYVVHYTDFSPNRKAPLSREVRVSSSVTQIEQLWDELKEANIKKGWEHHSASVAALAVETILVAPTATPDAQPVETTAAGKKEPVAREAERKSAAKSKAPQKKMATSSRASKKKAVKKKSG